MKIQATEIREIAHLLISDDYKQRFVGEYWELRVRLEKLEDMLRKEELGVLGCSRIQAGLSCRNLAGSGPLDAHLSRDP